jgi:hypothetical protein
MATVEECRTALMDIASRLSADPETGRKIDLNRSVACHIRDLGVHFRGRISGGSIDDLAEGDDPTAQIRLDVSGDDLLALVRGELHIASAWASGRVSIKASFGDLLKLRKLL